MRLMFALLGLSISLACSRQSAQAQQNCDAVLARDSIHFLSTDKRRQLAWFKLMDQQSFEANKHSLDTQYKAFGLNYADASQRRNALLAKERYGVTETEAKAELLSGMSEGQLTAWTQCLRQKGNVLSAYPTQMSDESGILVLEWMPAAGVGDLTDLRTDFYNIKASEHVQAFKAKKSFVKGSERLLLERQPAGTQMYVTVNGKGGTESLKFSVSESFYIPKKIVVTPPRVPSADEAWRVVAESDLAGVVQALVNGWPVGRHIDSEQNTMLHLAGERCSTEVIRVLREAGASRDVQNVWDDSPAKIASVRCGKDLPSNMAYQEMMK